MKLSAFVETLQSKKIKRILYITVVLWIAVLTQILVNYYFTDEGKLVDAFTNTNSSILSSNLYLVADLGDNYLSEEDEKNLLQYMSTKIGLNEVGNLIKEEKNNGIYIKKDSKDAKTIIRLVRNKEIRKGVSIIKRYIIVDLTIKQDCNTILEFKDKVEKIADKLKAKTVESQVTFNGLYHGRVLEYEKDRISEKFLKELQAKTVVKYNDGDIYRIYAYTGLIGDYIKVDGKKINVNVVFTYNENEKSTNLYVATPILNTDY